MHATVYELMRDHVRSMYFALTGSDLPSEGQAHPHEDSVSSDSVTGLFGYLEGAVRSLPDVATRVSPFSFAPPVDALDEGNAFLFEVALPGVEREDVNVEVQGEVLMIWGVRGGEHAPNGRRLCHAEIPRGPFRRVIRLSSPVDSDPQLSIDQGILRIHLAKAPHVAASEASQQPTPQKGNEP